MFDGGSGVGVGVGVGGGGDDDDDDRDTMIPFCHQRAARMRPRSTAGLLLLLMMTMTSITDCIASDEQLHHQPVRFDGEVNIGILVNLHHPPEDSLGALESEFCGPINVDALQQVMAAKWAVDVINNQSLPHELNIGLQLHDTCNKEELTQRHLYRVISHTRRSGNDLVASPAGSSPPLLGMIGIGAPTLLAQTSGALRAFDIPLISASPEHADSLVGRSADNVLTTAPDMSGQARALASLAFEMSARSVSLISSSHHIIQTFLSEATAMGIRVPRILELSHPSQVETFLAHASSSPVVVLIVGAHEAVAVAEHLKHAQLINNSENGNTVWLIGSLGLDLKRLSAWRSVFDGGVFVEPHMPELKEFRKYFVGALQDPKRSMKKLIAEYKEEMFGCTHQPQSMSSSFLMPCDEIPAHEIEMRFQQDAQVSFVVKAVSALTAAFRLVQLDHCVNNVEAACLREVDDNLHEDISTNLRKLSFSSMMPHGDGGPGRKAKEVEGTQHHFTRNGKLVANKQQIYLIDKSTGLEQVGWYSEDEGLHLEESLSNLVPTTQSPVFSPLINKEEDRSTFSKSIKDHDFNPDEDEEDESDTTIHMKSPTQLETLPIFSYESFLSRTWAIIVISAAIFGFLVSFWMLLYVFLKMCDGTLAGNQAMGVFLLFGVMTLFCSVIPWVMPPNEMVCALRHFLHPLLLVLCFSVLLVKSMQLRSLVTIGLGGSIPQVNQLLSLFFMVMVQVVIAAEWYLATSPIGIQLTDGYPECGVSRARFLLLHIYPAVLLLLTFFYGVSVLKVKRNFNEGRWITCAAAFIIPIFAAWPVVYYFAPVPFHDPSVAVSVVAVAGILLAAIFLPKMHTIALQSKLKTYLSRSHSDATVYTGFSDYVAFPKQQPLYPIYGYTTNHFVPAATSNSSRQSKNGGTNVAYVNPPAGGAPIKTYAEWSREYSPSNHHLHQHRMQQYHHHHHHRHPGHHHHSHHRDSVVDDDRSPLVSPQVILPEESLDSRRLTIAQRRSRSHDSSYSGSGDNHSVAGDSPMDSSEQRRMRRHSQSPSDGMILTAAGLALESSSNKRPRQRQREPAEFTVSEVYLTH